MIVKVNLRLLEKGPARLDGDLAVTEFLADHQDEVVRFTTPVSYSLEVIRQEAGLLVTGWLSAGLECDCVRCLKSFPEKLLVDDLETLVALEGEDAAPREGDFVDLTPMLREDTFLALPTRPLCKPECRGLAKSEPARDLRLREGPLDTPAPATWAALDRLKL